MKIPLDGVQFAFGYQWYTPDGYGVVVEGDGVWMPDLRVRRWSIYIDTQRKEVAISNAPPDDDSQETWTFVQRGPWHVMWPIFLSYVQMLYQPER